MIDNKELKTPYYCFDESILRRHLVELNTIREKYTDDDLRFCYAVKANSFLIPYMDKYVDHFEVCSWGELKICIQYGVNPGKIILSGVNKEVGMIADAIEYGVRLFTAESMHQYHEIVRQVEGTDISISLLPRLSNGAQFGMDQSCIEEIIKDSAGHSGVKVIGIHYFTGTQKKKYSKIESELKLLEEFIDRLKDKYAFEAELLEYGPGLGVPYFIGDDFDDYYSVYEEMVRFISSANYSYRVNLEMGRFFVASCGEYVTSVADVKGTPEAPILILDGGRNHISYYGQNMVMKTPVIVPEKGKETDVVPCDLYGSLCSFNDMIARAVMISEPKIGDRLSFKNIGAYSITEGIYLFLSRDLPAVYVKEEDGSYRMLRNSNNTYETNCFHM
ncbi:diaminopimelate decarboxylase family protein [Butyrivibrio sp. YAB3001]|uniref:diaminopimelate decarboxylase family protein n=1 Tax=Butyrivibrio sp. YAB3001 TaxID=1520812 RepID=UPI0008F68BAA|nr:hypothetical protein [Butyrivibrio sp. YAB3001]SFB96327.1 diaminopimelate decarboxylase [Butyrivibrio sp. YAB3001]